MKYTYTTNINCSGCVAKVKPHLDAASEIQTWEVDTENPEKVLSIETSLSSDEVMEIVKAAGFRIEEKKKGLWSRLGVK